MHSEMPLELTTSILTQCSSAENLLLENGGIAIEGDFHLHRRDGVAEPLPRPGSVAMTA